MGRSFYYTDEAHLHGAALTFAAAISSDPASYGLTEQQCVDYTAVAQQYAEQYFISGRPGVRTAVTQVAKREAKRALLDASAALAAIINAHPATTDDVRVKLGLAITEPPQPPRTPGTPGTPGNFSIQLSPIGLLMLKWKCANPQRGVMYIVSRSTGGGAFEYLGVTGERRFTDQTIPAGATAIVYQVQAVRLKQAGQRAMFNVNFGLNGKKLPTSMVPLRAA